VTVNRYFAIARFAAVALLALGLAATAHAGTRLYSGSYTIQGFGNDTTTGTTVKRQTDDFEAYPWYGNCHIGPYHAEEVVTFPTPNNPPGTGIVTLTLPKYGGQAAIHDTNADGIGDRALNCLDEQNQINSPVSVYNLINTTGANTSGVHDSQRGVPARADGLLGLELWSVRLRHLLHGLLE
jgi:hypothetical protein